MNKNTTISESRWPYRIGCLLVCVVFPLIWIGNLVTTSDAGMAVPDWPNTYGYNLFAYPYREWFFGPWDLFVEHGHRLFASLAGVISIVLVIVTWRNDRRRSVVVFSVMILLLVILQGVLGGIRVILDARSLAKVHGCVGPAFLAAAVGFCVVTSRWWLQRENRVSCFMIGWIPWSALLMLGVSYLQLVLGAFLRHIDDTARPKQFRLLVALHILTAIIIVFGTWAQFLLTRRAVLTEVRIKSSINFLALLVLIQFSLGLGTWVVKFGWPIWFENYLWAARYTVAEKSFFQINLVTAHAAVGSLILAFWTMHALRAIRAIGLRNQPGEVQRQKTV